MYKMNKKQCEVMTEMCWCSEYIGARDTVHWQVGRGTTAEQLQREYAEVKRVKRSALMAFGELKPDDTFEQDGNIAMMRRGAGSGSGSSSWEQSVFIIQDEVLKECHWMELAGSVEEFLKEKGEQYKTVLYKGAVLHGDIIFDRLRHRRLTLVGALLTRTTSTAT